MSHQNKRPVTVEDLLRLKATERPPAEFWERFDRELRAKQLAALVEKRPWWQTMPRVFTGWRRYHLPLGATAALAITFVSLREYSGSVDTVPIAPRQERAAAPSVVPAATATEFAVVTGPSVAAATVVAVETDPVDETVTPAAGSLAPGEASNLVSLGAVADYQPTPTEIAPSARSIAANLAAARVAEPAIGRGLLDATPAAELRTLPRGAIVEPLAQMALPGENRRAKFISAIAFTAATDTGTRAGERVARNLSDERLNEEAIRRFKVKANAFTLKM